MLKFCKLNPKNKDRCYDAIITGFKAIFVALLIAAGSAGVTHYANNVAQEKQIYMESRKAANQLALEIAETMSIRHHAALRAAAGYHWNVDQKLRYEQYDQQVVNWNKKRLTLLTLTKRYFGIETEKDFYKIIEDFRIIHTEIMKAKGLYDAEKPLPDLSPLMDKIYKMDDTITQFSDKMQNQLQDGKVDVYKPSPPIKEPE